MGALGPEWGWGHGEQDKYEGTGSRMGTGTPGAGWRWGHQEQDRDADTRSRAAARVTSSRTGTLGAGLGLTPLGARCSRRCIPPGTGEVSGVGAQTGTTEGLLQHHSLLMTPLQMGVFAPLVGPGAEPR